MTAQPTPNQQLLTRWAPLVYIHPEETYLPASVMTLLNGAYLYEKDQPIANPPLAISQLPTGPTFNGDYSLYYPDQKNWKDLPADSPLRGDPLVNLNIWGKELSASQAQCYGHVIPPTTSKTFTDLLYCFCAGYNGPSGLDGWLPAAGVHVGDWEHVVVRVTQPTGGQPSVPLALYYARHGTNDGEWYQPTQCYWVNPATGVVGAYDPSQTQQPIVYSAWYSHASYPTAGRHSNPTWKHAASDHCSDKGPIWPTWQTVVDCGTVSNPTPGQEWIGYCGRWGNKKGPLITEEGPETPSFQIWWNFFVPPSYPWVSHSKIGNNTLSNQRPGLATVGSTAYCAFTGLDPKLNFLTFSNGQWSHPQIILEQSRASSGIAMAAMGSQIVIVFNPGGQNPILQMATYDTTTLNWSGPQSTTISSNSGAALTEHKGTLFLAVLDPPQGAADNGSYISIYYYANGSWERTLGVPQAITCTEPSLATYNGVLYCAWVGVGDNQLYWSSSPTGYQSWSPMQPMSNNKTGSGPGLQQFRYDDNFDILFCFYQGLGNNFDYTVFDGDQWSLYAQVSGFEAIAGPAVTVCSDQLVGVYVGESEGNALYSFTLPAVHQRGPRQG
jgi:hypothetical protein